MESWPGEPLRHPATFKSSFNVGFKPCDISRGAMKAAYHLTSGHPISAPLSGDNGTYLPRVAGRERQWKWENTYNRPGATPGIIGAVVPAIILFNYHILKKKKKCKELHQQRISAIATESFLIEPPFPSFQPASPSPWNLPSTPPPAPDISHLATGISRHNPSSPTSACTPQLLPESCTPSALPLPPTPSTVCPYFR